MAPEDIAPVRVPLATPGLAVLLLEGDELTELAEEQAASRTARAEASARYAARHGVIMSILVNILLSRSSDKSDTETPVQRRKEHSLSEQILDWFR